MQEAVAYTRVSSDLQEAEQTIQGQRFAIDRWASSRDFVITKWYQDEGVSGDLKERQGLDSLRYDTEKGLVKNIILFDISRLARNTRLQQYLQYELGMNGAKLYFTDTTSTGDEKIDDMIQYMKGWGAQLEKERIVERTRIGRLRKVKDNQAIFVSTSVPYGYNHVARTKDTESTLEINQDEAPIVRKIFDLYAGGMSIRALELYLNKEKIPAKKGGLWKRTVLNRMMRNELYIGKFYYGKEKVDKKLVVKDEDGNPVYDLKGKVKVKEIRSIRPREEWIEVDKPELALVSQEIFDKVGAMLGENIIRHKRTARRIYPYANLLRCGVCGRYYNATHTVNQYGHTFYAYRCSSRNSSAKFYNPCGNRRVTQKYLDKVVWKYLQEHLLDAKWLKQFFINKDSNIKELEKQIEKRLLVATKELKRLKEQEERLLVAYRDGLFEPSLLDKELNAVKRRRLEIESEVKKDGEHLSEQRRISASSWTTQDAMHQFGNIVAMVGIMSGVPPADKQKAVLHKFIRQVTIYPDKMDIDGKVVLETKGNATTQTKADSMSLRRPNDNLGITKSDYPSLYRKEYSWAITLEDVPTYA